MRRACLFAALSATLAVAGCGHAAGGPAATSGGRTGSVGSGDPAGARATATTNRGDTAEFTIGFGKPEIASRADQQVVGACNSRLAQMGTSDERSLAVPVHISMRVASKQATAVTMPLSGLFSTQAGGGVSPDQTLVDLWAAEYDNGPQCSLLGEAGINWSASEGQPDRRQDMDLWLIVPNAIAPDDSSGANAVDHLVLIPGVLMSGAIANFQFDPRSSTSVVQCSATDPAAGTAYYLAVNPNVALSDGCSGVGSVPNSDAGGPAEGAARQCAGFPAGTSRTTKISGGNQTRYDRQASVYRVICGGFGTQGVQLTQGMRCALYAAAATFGGAPVVAPVERICDTSSVAEALRTGRWISAAGGKACDVLGNVFAGGVGVVVGGASGPAAGVVGVATYRTLGAALKVACGGLFDSGATNFGEKLEDKHEAQLMADVMRRGRCLRYSDTRHLLFFRHSSWSSESCQA